MVDPGNALHAGNAVTLQEHLQNRFSLFDGQVHAVKGVIAGVREHLPALRALIALTITAFSKATAFSTAVVAGHCDFSG